MVVLMILLLFFSVNFNFELTATIDRTTTGAVWGTDKKQKKRFGLNVSASLHPRRFKVLRNMGPTRQTDVDKSSKTAKQNNTTARK